ncbi:MAG: hypothetical protein V4683_16630 [Bacteroidota bacterium]
MENNYFKKAQIYIVGVVSLAICGLLAWDYFHGGVPAHHILNKKDLPEISNWWGGLLLPSLTWFLVYSIQKREKLTNKNWASFSNFPKKIIYGFAGALALSLSIAVLFTFDVHGIPGYLLMAALAFSFFYPIYRAECLIGFVIGMTYTFGGVLPIGIGCILAAFGFLSYNIIRPGVLFLANFLFRKGK